MTNQEWIERGEKVLAPTYKRFPVAFVEGKGQYLWDANGNKYTDFLAGIAVCNLGHSHPKLVEAIINQAKKLIHVSNFFNIPPQVELAELICKNSFGEKVFFCNSGAEANEAAIKLARMYGKKYLGKEKIEIITMLNSFHGRTLATVTATGQEKFHKGFEPLVEGFVYVPFNDIKSVENQISDHTLAIMVEPIQGEGGVNVPSENYLKDLRRLCDENDIILIFDEVQVGMGRTGKIFAYKWWDVEPDIMTLAKSLAGGVPIGAMVTTSKFAKAFEPGTHASTFGGNPLATAAGVATFNIIFEEDLLTHCFEIGDYFKKRLYYLKDKFPFIKDVRGKGLILAMELDVSCVDIVTKALEKGFLVNCTMDKVLRFLPPLIIQKDDIDNLVNCLEDIFKKI